MLDTDKYFFLEGINLQFLFSGHCQINQDRKPEGIEKMEFEAGITNNGTILGTLKLILKTDYPIERIKEYFHNTFELKGQDKSTGLSITMEKCFVRKYNQLGRSNDISCDILALDIVLKKDDLDDIFSGNSVIHFGLVNAFKIRRTTLPSGRIVLKRSEKTLLDINLNKFSFPSRVGELEFYNYSNIDDSEIIMLNYRIPLITSGISLKVSKNNYNISTTVKEATETIEEFLMISSFVQGSKQDWAFILVEVEGKPIFIHIRIIKYNAPSYVPLDNGVTNFVLYDLWIKLLTSTYKKNIALALDWYLESLSNEEAESKFLQMATALECLLSAYHKEKKSEFIFSKTLFRSLQRKIIPEIFNALHQLGIKEDEHKEEFETIKNSFQNLRRRTLANKFKLMLDQLEIDCSDVDLEPKNIAKIRNDIVHRGSLKYVNDETKLMEVYKEYKALWSAIIRIFFKLIGYNGEYFDPSLKLLKSV